MCQIPFSWRNFLNSELMNDGPLFDTMVLGRPGFFNANGTVLALRNVGVASGFKCNFVLNYFNPFVPNPA